MLRIEDSPKTETLVDLVHIDLRWNNMSWMSPAFVVVESEKHCNRVYHYQICYDA
jgi:hypothetical protein